MSWHDRWGHLNQDDRYSAAARSTAPIPISATGAVANDETCASANVLAIKSALSKSAATGRPVSIPPGTWLVEVTENGQQLFNLHSGAHVVGNGTIKVAPSSYDTYDVFCATGANDVRIDGITVEGDRHENTSGGDPFGMLLRFLGCSGVSVVGVTTRQAWGDGVYVGSDENDTPCSNVTIERLHSYDCNRGALTLVAVHGARINCCLLHDVDGSPPKFGISFEADARDMVKDVTVSNTEIYNCTHGAYDMQRRTGEQLGVTYSNCNIHHCVVGIAARAGSSITGGSISDCSDAAITIDGSPFFSRPEFTQGQPSIVLQGRPFFGYYLVRVDGSGGRGTATFRWSQDGGDTWAAEKVPIPVDGVAGLESTGGTLTFDDTTFSTGDEWDFGVHLDAVTGTWHFSAPYPGTGISVAGTPVAPTPRHDKYVLEFTSENLFRWSVDEGMTWQETEVSATGTASLGSTGAEIVFDGVYDAGCVYSWHTVIPNHAVSGVRILGNAHGIGIDGMCDVTITGCAVEGTALTAVGIGRRCSSSVITIANCSITRTARECVNVQSGEARILHNSLESCSANRNCIDFERNSSGVMRGNKVRDSGSMPRSARVKASCVGVVVERNDIRGAAGGILNEAAGTRIIGNDCRGSGGITSTGANCRVNDNDCEGASIGMSVTGSGSTAARNIDHDGTTYEM